MYTSSSSIDTPWLWENEDLLVCTLITSSSSQVHIGTWVNNFNLCHAQGLCILEIQSNCLQSEIFTFIKYQKSSRNKIYNDTRQYTCIIIITNCNPNSLIIIRIFWNIYHRGYYLHINTYNGYRFHNAVCLTIILLASLTWCSWTRCKSDDLAYDHVMTSSDHSGSTHCPSNHSQDTNVNL